MIRGKTWRTGPRLEVLGAWLDAYLAGASSYDADDIAKVTEQRPRPSYEERRAVFKPTGRPEPSRDPFPFYSKGGGLDSCVSAMPHRLVASKGSRFRSSSAAALGRRWQGD
jgi:hypothetical protein